MLWVRTRRKAEDRTEGQKDCRVWKEQDRLGFLRKLADLERAALAKGATTPTTSPDAPTPVTTGPDPGLGRVKELLHPEWELVEWIYRHQEEVRAWARGHGYTDPPSLG